jgi:serine protease AprX
MPTPLRVDAHPFYTGRGVTLAFLDSGFYPHPDLIYPKSGRAGGRVLCYADATGPEIIEHDLFNQRQFSIQPDWTTWHGTMTTSVAAGSGRKSGSLYRGIANQASLVLVKTGNRSGRGISEADIQRALEWVIANKARFDIRVVNISLGGDFPSNGKLSDLDQAVEQAVAAGLVVVAAAGNSGEERLLPPASAPSAITVGGYDDRNCHDRHLWRTYPSSYGHSPYGTNKPEIIAPAIWLAAPMVPHTRVHRQGMWLWQFDRAMKWAEDNLNNHTAKPLSGRGHVSTLIAEYRRRVRRKMNEGKYIHPHYQHVDGTSMAAPIVTAVIAQMLEANPSLTPAQVKRLLMLSASRASGMPAERQGAGMINSRRAVAAALRTEGGPLTSVPLTPHILADQIAFYYYEPGQSVRCVSLAGSFNGWNPRDFALQRLPGGLWKISLAALPPGKYRYKFLVNGYWIDDPENPERIEDGFGGFSSVLEVPQ